MLTITVLGDEMWDDEAEKFCYTESTELQFEHSLVSLSKWEARFHKRFLTPAQKSDEEMVGYIEAMLLTPGVGPGILNHLSLENVQAITDYINDPMTGSVVSELPRNGPRASEEISAELIYFWMSHYRIPYEAREWHLNQLFTLIKIHHAKSQKPQKMNRQSRVQQMAELNAARKAKLGTSG